MRDLLLSSPQGQWWTDFNYFVYLVHVKKLTIKKIWIWIYPFWVPRRWVADSWQTQASRGSWSSLQMKVSPSTHVEKQRTWLSLFHQHTKSCKCVLLCGLWRVVDYCTTSCISFYAHSDLLFTTPTCFLIDILGTFSSENHVWGRICYETSFIHSIDFCGWWYSCVSSSILRRTTLNQRSIMAASVVAMALVSENCSDFLTDNSGWSLMNQIEPDCADYLPALTPAPDLKVQIWWISSPTRKELTEKENWINNKTELTHWNADMFYTFVSTWAIKPML